MSGNSVQCQSQHFLLKWNNHRSNLVSVFENLLQGESLVDVTLAVEGKFLKAHKIVLSACSPYFQSMFVNSASVEKHPILIFHDLKFTHLKTLLEFMYRGEISIDEKDLSEILKVAEALSIRGLSSFESDDEDSNSEQNGGSNSSSSSGSQPNNSHLNIPQQSTPVPAPKTYNKKEKSPLPRQESPRMSHLPHPNTPNLNNSPSENHHNFYHTPPFGSSALCDSNGHNLTPSPLPVAKAPPKALKRKEKEKLGKVEKTEKIEKIEPKITLITDAPPPIKRKRGRQPKNQLASTNSVELRPPILKAPQDIYIVPETVSNSKPLKSPVGVKGVRRRVPKKLALKREKVPRNSSEHNLGEEGEGMSTSEPLTEMSVRGLDLFRYASVEDGVYRCMECEKLQIRKSFKNKYSFQRHAFLYHEGNMRKVFPCPICAREFSRPDKMKNHLKSIHQGGPSAKDGLSPTRELESETTTGSKVGDNNCDY